jgi:hypothetical protein
MSPSISLPVYTKHPFKCVLELWLAMLVFAGVMLLLEFVVEEERKRVGLAVTIVADSRYLTLL